jgi:hypothetical protein
MTIKIVLAIVAIICCSIALIIDVIHSDVGGAICMLLLVFLNVYILGYNLDKRNEPQEIQTTIVKDVQGFSVDSTLTISGVDTTKTYTITYLK